MLFLQMAALADNDLPRLKTKVKALSEQVQQLKSDIAQASHVTPSSGFSLRRVLNFACNTSHGWVKYVYILL